MEVKQVTALPKGLEVRAIEVIDEVLTITAVSTQAHPACPLCGTPATRVHSRYCRQVADLPCSGQQVRLLVQVRKCFCDTPTCSRKIFVERLTPFVDAFARVTRRLYQIGQIIGLATGGRLGIRVTDRLGIETTRQTILRRIMALPPEPVGEVSQIGIDDFSFRRGRKFGTIIVDLLTHKVLDVLPDRTADTQERHKRSIGFCADCGSNCLLFKRYRLLQPLSKMSWQRRPFGSSFVILRNWMKPSKEL